MAAMLVLVWLAFQLLLSSAVSSDVTTVSVRSGEAVLLTSDPQKAGRGLMSDVRWSRLPLVVSLKANMTTCFHGRCELLSDGSLSFSRAAPDDSGEYVVEVFNHAGKQVLRRRFELVVHGEDGGGGASAYSLTGVLMGAVVLLLLFGVVVFILRKRRRHSAAASELLENNIYVEMHSCHSSQRTAEKMKEDLEPVYVTCRPAVTMETETMQ